MTKCVKCGNKLPFLYAMFRAENAGGDDWFCEACTKLRDEGVALESSDAVIGVLKEQEILKENEDILANISAIAFYKVPRSFGGEMLSSLKNRLTFKNLLNTYSLNDVVKTFDDIHNEVIPVECDLFATNIGLIAFLKGFPKNKTFWFKFKYDAELEFDTRKDSITLPIGNIVWGNDLFMLFKPGLYHVRDIEALKTFSKIVEKNLQKGKSLNKDTSGIPEQIKKLAELRDQGILSEKEFSEKKKELLSKM